MSFCLDIMEKIDLKDRKILYELDIDSRQSFRSIGRKIGLSKDAVASRVNKLKESGIINSFFTVIDSSKLGFISFRFYLTFQHTTPEIENEIIDYFIKNKNVWWVTSIKGRYNLAVAIWVEEINDFHVFWKNTLKKYHNYIQDQVFSVYLSLSTYRSSFLLLDEFDKSDRKKVEVVGGGRKVKIDNLDLQILRLIATNARMLTLEIAEKLNSSAATIAKRIKKLIKLGVIKGFRISTDYSKLGYQFYGAYIKLVDYNKRDKIINYIISNPHLLLLTETAGYTDLELDFVVINVEQFLKIIEDLTIKFPNTIKNYDYFYQSKIHKVQYIPEVMIK